VRHASCGELVDETRQALGLGAPPRPRRRWRIVVAAAVAVLLAAAVSVALVSRPWEGAPAPPSGALVRIDPNRDRVASREPVPGYPSALVVTGLGVWMADFRSGALWRFEPGTGGLQRISSPGEPRDLAADGTKVYVASDGPKLFSGNVSRHDAGTGVREDAVELLPCALASGDGVVWAAGCPYVQRLSTDVGPLRETARVLVPLSNPRRASTNRTQVRELAVGGGSLWVLGDALDRRLWRLDAQTGDIQATIDLPFPPRSVVFGAGLVWITDPLDDAVIPVDPAANRVLAPVRVGRGAAGVAVGAGAVWVANSLDGTVSRIDAGSQRVVRTVDVGGRPHELAVGRDAVWVTTHAD
jgi:YVTN family beta-propeller protein